MLTLHSSGNRCGILRVVGCMLLRETDYAGKARHLTPHRESPPNLTSLALAQLKHSPIPSRVFGPALVTILSILSPTRREGHIEALALHQTLLAHPVRTSCQVRSMAALHSPLPCPGFFSLGAGCRAMADLWVPARARSEDYSALKWLIMSGRRA